MTLRRGRSHYQQLTEFERGSIIIELKKGGFSFHDIAERLESQRVDLLAHQILLQMRMGYHWKTTTASSTTRIKQP
ncbi:hypothetical protein TNCV_4252541 [Trichonephila clavipes]|nr:hypothetical protein TNCV_4252541 [Trichonephila clavipes]